MDFDLKEKDENGTKYLLNGVNAKIHFNTGDLAGYELEIHDYNHETKEFHIIKFADENGYEFPSKDSDAFRIGIGDEYVILDIQMPQTYIDNAEAELFDKADEYLSDKLEPNIQYLLDVDTLHLQRILNDTVTQFFLIGDFIKVIDEDFDINRYIRIKSIERDLKNPFDYKLTLSDSKVTNFLSGTIPGEINTIKNIIKLNNLNDPAKARRNWKDAQEVLNMVFDVEGDYYTEKIKPNSIETTHLQVGAKSMQFNLIDSFFEPNFEGNPNKIRWSACKLVHFAISDKIVDWQIQGGQKDLESNKPYYLYAKCNKSNNIGVIEITETQYTVDQGSFYYFLVGIINTYSDDVKAREISLMYGFTTVSGRFIKTGRISSNDGSTYFDLDSGEFKGKFTFTNGESVEEAITNQEIYIEYSQNGIDWHSTFLYDDVFMRQKKGDGAWSNAIRIVGIQGIKGDKGTDGQTQYVHIRYSANSDGSSMTTSPQANTAYIGIVTTTSSIAPTSNTSYTWAKFKGEQGTQGVPGIPGADGSSLFTWVKYADTPTSGMSDYPDDKLYIGLAYNKVTATESNNYEDYSWSLMPQNIEIGGRNYILNSKNEREQVNSTTTENYIYYDLSTTNNAQLEPNTVYTLSADLWMTANVTSIDMFFISTNTQHRSRNKVSLPAQTWIRETFTFTTGDATPHNGQIRFDLNGSTNGQPATLKTRLVKLEKGNKATDFTPAPEDVEASILQSKTDSINASKAYSDAQDELKRIQIEAYADGKVTAAEQRAIDDATAKAEAAKVYAAAQDNLLRVQLEAYADGQITAEEQARIQQMQDNLAAAKSYADAQANLAKIAANAYADGVIDEEEARAIADATAKMEAAKQHAQNLVNNIQIGGRNLFLDSAFSVKPAIDIAESTIDTNLIHWKAFNEDEIKPPFNNQVLQIESVSGFGDKYFLLDQFVEVKDNEDYIFHYDTSCGKVNSVTLSDSNYIFFYDSNKVIISFNRFGMLYSKAWSRNEIKFSTPLNTRYVRIRFGYNASGSGGFWIAFANLKLEKGNKATDWTPAPEDVEASILQAKQLAEQANQKVADIANDNVLSASEKQQISNEWNRIKTEYTTNYALAQLYGIVTRYYVNAYNDLNYYISPMLVDLNSNSSIIGEVFRQRFKNYYDRNLEILVAINDYLKTSTDNNSNSIGLINQTIDRINKITSFLGTTIDGNVVATGVVLVGDGNEGTGGMSGIRDQGQESIFLYSGQTFNNRYSAPFRVTHGGSVVMTNAYVSGHVTATSGTFSGRIEAQTGYIGGLTLQDKLLTTTDVNSGIWFTYENDDYKSSIRMGNNIGTGILPNQNYYPFLMIQNQAKKVVSPWESYKAGIHLDMKSFNDNILSYPAIEVKNGHYQGLAFNVESYSSKSTISRDTDLCYASIASGMPSEVYLPDNPRQGKTLTIINPDPNIGSVTVRSRNHSIASKWLHQDKSLSFNATMMLVFMGTSWITIVRT